MITVITNDDAKEFRGLSTDPKPLGLDEDPAATFTTYEKFKYRISNGSMYFEMDTGEVYMYAVYVSADPSVKNTAAWLLI